MILEKIHLLNLKPLQEKRAERYHLTISNDQGKKAKPKALSIIQDEQDEQFARIKVYRLALIE